jgi:hypothetical protein
MHGISVIYSWAFQGASNIIKVRVLKNRRDTIRRSVQIVKMGVPVVRSKISAIYKPEYINYRSEMGHGDFQIKAATWIK